MISNFLTNKIVRSDMEEIYNRNVEWERLYNNKILISGATGMLASYIVYFLIYLNEFHNAGITIIVIVRNKDKCFTKFGEFIQKKYFKIITDDITEVVNYPEHVDYIIHAASLASPQYYAVQPVEVILPNSIGTWRMLEFAKKTKAKSFLLFSTCDVYGDVSLQNIKTVTEQNMGIIDPLNIHSCYNESKRLSETLCKAYFIEHKVPIKIVRIFHTYAPTMDLEKDPRVFASFVKCITENKNIIMHSDGSSRRSFCYITDAIAAYLKVMLDGESGEAYNIGNTEQFVSMLELGETLCSLVSDKHLKVIHEERKNTESYTENRIADKPFDNSKSIKLGCTFIVDIKNGFSRVLNYFNSI